MTGTPESRAASARSRTCGMIRFARGVPSFPVTKSFTKSTIKSASVIDSPPPRTRRPPISVALAAVWTVSYLSGGNDEPETAAGVDEPRAAEPGVRQQATDPGGREEPRALEREVQLDPVQEGMGAGARVRAGMEEALAHDEPPARPERTTAVPEQAGLGRRAVQDLAQVRDVELVPEPHRLAGPADEADTPSDVRPSGVPPRPAERL